MKRLTLLRIVGCVLFISLMLFPTNSVVHVGEGNIFTKYFTEPIEVMYVVFYDGHLFRFTSYHEDRIEMAYWTFKETIEGKGRKIENIAIVIHNHLSGYGSTFSPGDEKWWRRMNGDGFRGSFCLYRPRGKIKCERCEDD